MLVADFFQSIILCLAVLILLPLSLKAAGGFGTMVSQAPEGFFDLLTPPYHFFDWLMFAVIISLSYNATWGLVQKYNCVATEADARKVAILMGALTFIGPLIFFMPAMAGRIFLPELMNQPNGPAESYVQVALHVLPTGVMGLLVAGMFSATLSTLGNDYNVLSGVLTKDFYGKVINPDADEASLIKWGRINTVIIGLLTIFFAIAINYVQGFNLFDIMKKSFGALGPAIMLPLLGGLLTRKINARGAFTGVIFGTVSGIGLVVINFILIGKYSDLIAESQFWSYWLKQGFDNISIIINFATTIFGMWFGTKISVTPPDEQVRVKEFFSRMDVATEPKVEKARQTQSPFSVVGLALLLMGATLTVVSIIMLVGYNDSFAFGLDIFAGILLLGLGALLWFFTRRKTDTD